MKTLLTYLALATLATAATGDFLFQKKTSTGYTPVLITPENGKVISWSGGAPINVTAGSDLTAGPVRSSAGTSSIAADQITATMLATGIPVAKITGLGTAATASSTSSFTTVSGAQTTFACDASKLVQAGKITLTGHTELMITGATTGMRGVLLVTQGGIGSHTLKILNLSSKEAGFALSTAVGSVDRLSWEFDGTTFFWTIVNDLDADWIPTDNANLIYWWDVQDSSKVLTTADTVASDGNTVLKLVDRKAGHTLAITANGPTLDADGAPNSKRCLVFDGTNDALFTASNIIPQPSTVVTVHRQVTHAASEFIWDTSASGPRAALYQFGSSGSLAAAGNSIGAAQTMLRWDVVTTTHNTTTTGIQFNGDTAAAGSSSTQANVRFALGASAGSPPSSGFANIEIAEVLVFNSIIDATALGQVRGYLAKKYGNIFQGQVVCDGNSWTAGSGSTGGLTYPAQLQTLMGGATVVKFANFGVGGQTTRQMTADAVAQVDAIYSAERPYNILIGWEFTNDWYAYTNTDGQTARAASDLTLANYWTYLDARRAAGYRTIAVTIKPSTTYSLGANETERTYVNAAIRAGWSAHAAGLVDVAADARIGDDGDDTNLTYYNADGIHLNNAGYGVVAELAKVVVDSIK